MPSSANPKTRTLNGETLNPYAVGPGIGIDMVCFAVIVAQPQNPHHRISQHYNGFMPLLHHLLSFLSRAAMYMFSCPLHLESS